MDLSKREGGELSGELKIGVIPTDRALSASLVYRALFEEVSQSAALDRRDENGSNYQFAERGQDRRRHISDAIA